VYQLTDSGTARGAAAASTAAEYSDWRGVIGSGIYETYSVKFVVHPTVTDNVVMILITCGTN
jgi:hypothetical protein